MPKPEEKRSEKQRIPTQYVYYYRSPEHHGSYVLSIVFAFDKEDDVYQFAYSLPYSYSRLQAYLDKLDGQPYIKRETIARSLQDRKVDLLTISSNATPCLETEASEAEASSAQTPKVVVITARTHPGETPSSYVIQGLINFLLSQHPVAQTMRDYVTFKIVPMVNPDGVVLGNYRSNLLGSDLNRVWNKTSEWTHPVLYALKKVITDLDRKTEEVLDLYLDVHAHSALLGSFIYGNMYDDVYRLERHLLFPKLLSQVADDFSLDNTIYNRDPLKAGTGRR
ncbi:Cytosolic carboxypeptidase 6 [Chamberlinius hualienensis]